MKQHLLVPRKAIHAVLEALFWGIGGIGGRRSKFKSKYIKCKCKM